MMSMIQQILNQKYKYFYKKLVNILSNNKKNLFLLFLTI